MAAQCFGTIKSKVARLTRLDACGAPVVGPDTTVVTNGYISIDVSPQYEDGSPARIMNAWGDLIANEVDDPTFLGANVTITANKVDIATLDIVSDARQVLSGADPVGAVYAEGKVTTRFAVETWTKVLGSDCAGGSQQYVYWLFPVLGNGRLGDLTLGAEAASFVLSGSTLAAPANTWLAGATPATTGDPYSQSYLPANASIAAGDHFYFGLTTVAPPTAACGAVALA